MMRPRSFRTPKSLGTYAHSSRSVDFGDPNRIDGRSLSGSIGWVYFSKIVFKKLFNASHDFLSASAL
jgi:hypothetical protein